MGTGKGVLGGNREGNRVVGLGGFAPSRYSRSIQDGRLNEHIDIHAWSLWTGTGRDLGLRYKIL